MGFFSKLFDSSSGIDKEMEDLYVPAIQEMTGMDLSQARNAFHDLYKQAHEEAKEEGSINLPLDFGDKLLEGESTNAEIKSILEKKRSEGVNDEDIRWWSNRHEIERKLMMKIDELNKYVLLSQYREERLTVDEATQRINKHFPLYGNLDSYSTSTEEDRPLPFELKDRINIYIINRAKLDPDKFKQEVEEASSFNSFIRNEIRRGKVGSIND